MGPIPAVLLGLALSLIYHAQLHFARLHGEALERLRWLAWLRGSWEQAQFELDMSANVHGLRTADTIAEAFNRVLSSFHDWPDSSDADDIMLVGASPIDDESD